VDDDGAVRLSWGGRTLAVLEEEVLDGTTYFADLEALSTSLPDDVEGA
jgi:hypothetical protein